MRALRASCLSLLAATLPAAQVLPFRNFSTREGLPHENVAALFEDSRGFLWVGTYDGLARFDGASFTSYGAADGLASTVSFAIAEDGYGDVWFGVHTAGVARLRLASGAAARRRASNAWRSSRSARTRPRTTSRLSSSWGSVPGSRARVGSMP